jgi:hypothetical protein
MADLIETSVWEPGIYQLEELDPVRGGADQVDNRQAQELANRTAFLKSGLDTHVAAAAPHSGHETPTGAQDKVDTHANLTTAHSATSAATASRIMMRDASGRAKVAAPASADDIARKDTVDAHTSVAAPHSGHETPTGAQDKVDTHANLTTAHSATSAATINRIIMRDASGRAKVAAPAAADDIARLDTFTGHTDAVAPHSGHETLAGAQDKVNTHNAVTSAHSATSAATASRIMMRDASGRAKVAAPSAADDIARKDTVDAHANSTGTVHGAATTAVANTLAFRDAAGRLEAIAGIAGNDVVNFGQFAAAKTASGYQKLPSGLIIQFFDLTITTNEIQTYSFPIAFPTACLNMQVANRTSLVFALIQILSNTQFTANRDNGSSGTTYYYGMAIGY